MTDHLGFPLVLGTMQFGWTLSDEESFALLDLFVESGGSHIDTADMYGLDQGLAIGDRYFEAVGRAESIIGEWLRTRKLRDAVSIATKVRARTWAGEDGEGLNERHVVKAVEGSLNRLGVDSIDLYYAHWPDPATPYEETAECFDRLMSAGKIQSVGASNYTADELGRWLDVCEKYGLAQPSASQNRYSLLHRASVERGVVQLCHAHGMALFAYSALGAGFLSGKYRVGTAREPGVRAAYVEQFLSPPGLALLHEVEEVAAGFGCSSAEVAIAWVLHQPGVSGVVVGATSPGQLRTLLRAAGLELSPDDVERLNRFSWIECPNEFARSRVADSQAETASASPRSRGEEG